LIVILGLSLYFNQKYKEVDLDEKITTSTAEILIENVSLLSENSKKQLFTEYPTLESNDLEILEIEYLIANKSDTIVQDHYISINDNKYCRPSYTIESNTLCGLDVLNNENPKNYYVITNISTIPSDSRIKLHITYYANDFKKDFGLDNEIVVDLGTLLNYMSSE
jgi:hypothetical protein